jgi:hypothetical protein
MENPAPSALEASATGIPVSDTEAPEIDWSQSLDLITGDGSIRPVRLCPEDKLPHWVETNPDDDGDFWLFLPDGKGGESRFCSDVTGDAEPWGTVRNRAADGGAA